MPITTERALFSGSLAWRRTVCTTSLPSGPTRSRISFTIFPSTVAWSKISPATATAIKTSGASERSV
jgi:hypothetical protein